MKYSILGLIVLSMLIGMAGADVSVSEDIVGTGSFWSSTDHNGVADRTGGYGEWAYGRVVGPSSLISMYSFEGIGGWYANMYRNGNYSSWMRAYDLTSFDADIASGVEGEEQYMDINGTGAMKGAVYSIGKFGRPEDLTRTYITGSFQINRTVKA